MPDTVWHEYNADTPSLDALLKLLSFLRAFKIESWHWFFDEPWSPWVVRIETLGSVQLDPLTNLMNKGRWKVISMLDDERAYGKVWSEVKRFFMASSEVGLSIALAQWQGQKLGEARQLEPAKLLHCAMNAWGLQVPDESALLWDMTNRTTLKQVLEGAFGEQVYTEKAELVEGIFGHLRATRQYYGRFEW